MNVILIRLRPNVCDTPSDGADSRTCFHARHERGDVKLMSPFPWIERTRVRVSEMCSLWLLWVMDESSWQEFLDLEFLDLEQVNLGPLI
jgi:hypothetical protein